MQLTAVRESLGRLSLGILLVGVGMSISAALAYAVGYSLATIRPINAVVVHRGALVGVCIGIPALIAAVFLTLMVIDTVRWRNETRFLKRVLMHYTY